LTIRAFLDNGVLIAAHHGKPAEREASLAIVNNPAHRFIASPFVRLETIPKAVYHKNKAEIHFYETYFDNVRIWINDVDSILRIALDESERCGIAAMDALHVAAAYLAEAEVLYTLERHTKPIYRTALVRVVSVEPKSE